MRSLNETLVGVRARRGCAVLAVAESFGKVTFKLTAVVGLPGEVTEPNP